MLINRDWFSYFKWNAILFLVDRTRSVWCGKMIRYYGANVNERYARNMNEIKMFDKVEEKCGDRMQQRSLILA